MLDHPSSTPPAWARNAQVGDVVLFRFPLPPEVSPMRSVPCLILERHSDDTETWLTLAPGVCLTKRSPLVSVQDPKELTAAGLSQATVFDLGHVLTVAAKNRSFLTRTGSPIIGRLTGDSLALMHRMRAGLHVRHLCAQELRRLRKRYGDCASSHASSQPAFQQSLKDN